jgi:hypothetical protein
VRIVFFAVAFLATLAAGFVIGYAVGLRGSETASATSPPQTLPGSPKVGPDTNVYEHIRKLAELRGEGHITPEEFEAKKRELLDPL